MKTIDTLREYRNTCTVSYWRDGWHRIAAKVGKPITITSVDNDIKLPFGQVHPCGSGRGGRVRMGDEMRPTDYAVTCADEDADALTKAHKAYIDELLARV
jgi:hypothetical protein